MSYEKGDVTVFRQCPDLRDDLCEHDPEHDYISDSRNETVALIGACLPHSCDQWVIGGPDEIRALISDLQSALVEIEGDKSR